MKEFISVFQLSKTIIFEVNYYTLSTNTHAYFTTSVAQFCKNKRDFNCAGQAQKELTTNFFYARRFWRKWDKFHLKDLTPEQYDELQNDLNELKQHYNYMYTELDESNKPYSPHFSFYRLAEWSKQPPKK